MKRKKLAALLLAGVMALGLTGCMGHLFPRVMTVDGYEVPAGLYLLLQYDAYYEASGKVEKANKPGNKAVLSRKVDGQRASKWIQARTEELVRRYVAIERLSAARGLSLTQTDASTADQTAANYWQYLGTQYEANGIGPNTLRRSFRNQYLGDMLFEDLYGPDGERAPSDAELKEQYGERYAHLRFISIPLTDAGSNRVTTQTENEVEQEVGRMLAGLRAGSTFDDVATEYLPGIYEAIDRDWTDDMLSSVLTASYIAYDPEVSYASYSEDFLNHLQQAPVGDFGTYNNGSAILLYEKINTFESEGEFEEMRDSVVDVLCREDFEAFLREEYETYTVKKAFGATWYYRPSKIQVP